MSVKLSTIISGLEEALPILSTLTGHPEIGVLATSLIDKAEAEIARRQAAGGGVTRSDVLADAAATFTAAKQANADLKALGHESDGGQ